MSDTLTIPTDTLGTIELPFVTIAYQTEVGAERESRSLRAFFDPTIDGSTFDEFVSDFLAEQVELADEDSAELWREVEILTWLDAMTPNRDRRRCRIFDPKTFERCESLQTLVAATGTKHATLPEQLFAVTAGTAELSDNPFENAAYIRPLIRLPLFPAEYEEFRQLVLRETAEMRHQFDDILQKAITTAGREHFEQQGTTPSEVEFREAVTEIDDVELWNAAGSIIHKLMGQTLAETECRETHRGQRYRDLVDRIVQGEALLEVALENASNDRVAEADGKQTSGDTFDELAHTAHLPVELADNLLTDLIARMEEDLRTQQAGIGQDEPVEKQYIATMQEVRSSSDIVLKWSCLIHLKSNLVDRSECMRLIQREAELTSAKTYGMAAQLIFRYIRKSLSREERRAFALLYFPNPWLNGRIAAFDPLARSFIAGMDDETTDMMFSILIFKAESPETRTELGRRWNAFLRFYPHWLDMVRDDEREDRRRRSDRKRVASSFLDGLPDSKAISPEMTIQFAVVRSDRLPEWAGRYCTETQAKYLVAYYSDQLSERQIAEANSVTQQAVSKSITAGMKKLRRGLMADKVVELDD